MKRIRIALLLLFTMGALVTYGQVTVTGLVNDNSADYALPGVNIIEKGTTNGTITDFEGVFSLKVSDANATLVFSYIGYKTQEIALAGKTKLEIGLNVDQSSLDEVIVVGYGTQKKADLTGSVAVVEMDEMEKISNSNMGTMLQGRIAGVSVTSDGQPGADPSIRIRGFSTFGDASPLYVVDGVPVGGSIRDFSPNDIESMQVLKDASAAAIYGSRAANGVIIITTKKGKKDTPLSVSYSGYRGWDKVYQSIPMLGREDYQNTYNASMIANGMPIRPANDPTSEFYIDSLDTDWQKAGFKTGVRENHNVSLMGGGKYNTYAVVLDYMDSEGTLEGVGPSYNRYSVRANNTMERGFFKLGSSLVYTHTDQTDLNVTDAGGFAGGNPAMVIKLLQLLPTMAVYDPNHPTGYGTYDPAIQGEDYSLNILAVNNMREKKITVERMQANAYTELDFANLLGMKGQTLKYKLNLSYDKTVAHDFTWLPDFSLSNFYTNTLAFLDEATREYTVGLVENTLNYKNEIGLLKLDLLAGQSYQMRTHYSITGHGEGFTKPYFKELPNAAATSVKTYEDFSAVASYFGRANVDIADRYLLSASVRRDGTTRVKDHWGTYPSASIGWKIHNEPFFPVSKDIVSELKLRASYGTLGNENIGNYLYLGSLNRNVMYNFAGAAVQGSTMPSVVSSSLVWEEKEMSNFGVDLTLLDGSVTFSAEYYNSVTKDVLLAVPIPLSVGSINDAPTANAGILENSGIEVLLGYKGNVGDLRYTVNANAATLNNNVKSLGTADRPVYGAGSRTMSGFELGRHFGYVYDGIFQSQEEVDAAATQTASTRAGDIRFKDLNEDGIIDEEDRTDLGSAIPSLTYGLSLTLEYKNFDFAVLTNGATGFLINDALYRNLMHSGGGLNWHEDILDAWTETNTNTDIPRVVWQDPNGNGRDSDRPGWLQDGTYLKIGTISLGYTFPKSVLKNVLTSARIYGTVQNVYTFTKYKGYNPDFPGGVWSPGVIGGSFPTPRSFMVGVNLSF